MGGPFEGIWDTASWPVEALSLQIAPESWRVSGLAAGLELGNKCLEKNLPRKRTLRCSATLGVGGPISSPDSTIWAVFFFFLSSHLHETVVTSYLREYLQSVVLRVRHNAVCYSQQRQHRQRLCRVLT